MPSYLALILCTMCVIYFLRVEQKTTSNVSKVLWLPTVWMLIIATKPLSDWFGVYGESMDSGSPMDRNLHSIIICLGLLVIFNKKINVARFIKDQPWLMLLIFYMLLSVFWSDILYISFKRWIRELEAVIMAMVILTERDPRQAVESLLRKTIYILVPFSLLLIKYFHDLGVGYSAWTGEIEWVGVTLHKSALGRLCLIAAFFLIWSISIGSRSKDIYYAKYQKYVETIVLIMTFWLLKGPSLWASSATSFTSLGVGLALLAVLFWCKRRKLIIGAKTFSVVILITIGVGVNTPWVGGATVGSLTKVVGRNSTFTGRTEVWANLLPFVIKQPIWGAGFGGFWTDQTHDLIRVGEAHNGYLDICLGIGFIGLLLTIFYLLSFCQKVSKVFKYDYEWASLCICYLIMGCLHNITESSFDSFGRQLMAVILFLTVSLTNKAPYRSEHCRGVVPS